MLLLGALQKSKSENARFRGRPQATHPIIAAKQPDMIEFGSNLLIHLGLVSCARMLNKENREICEQLPEENYYHDEKLWTTCIKNVKQNQNVTVWAGK